MRWAKGIWKQEMAARAAAMLLLGFGLGLGLGGCTPGGRYADEENDQNIQAGKIQRRSGFYQEAEEAFQRALQNNPKSATAHYELGLLYYENMTNYPGALYHFERYRQLHPRPANEDVLKLMIIECKRELAADVPLGTIGLHQQRAIQQLRDTNALLLLELEKLRQQLATRSAQGPAVAAPQTAPDPAAAAEPPSRNPPSSAAATPSPTPTPNPVPTPAARGHTVRPGETMAAIARLYRIDLNALLAANPGVDPRRLQPGQRVIVPAP